MIDFLLAVPGKLTTIYSHLTTYLSSTRCVKIDNLDAAVTTRAGASTALSTATWTNTRAGYLDKININPTRDAPIATNFPPPDTAGATTEAPAIGAYNYTKAMACVLATTTSTTLVDAVNITGSGVLNFLVTGGGTLNQLQLIIDGITVVDLTCTGAATYQRTVIGAVTGGSTVPQIAFDQIPFKTSLVIKHRVTSSGTASTYYKLRRTS